ncbi:MAG TPA: ABC transporter permease [Tepidisphaeraceae bacterium]|jgi:ribose/xylose/arabinose/galactoside ABC-type transport system permease subunit|nr:ABC transporter permease [Tepidisphaeraceae bacterium]
MQSQTVLEQTSSRSAARWRIPRMQEAGLVVVIVLLAILLSAFSEPIWQQGHYVNNFFRLDNLIPNVLTPMSWMAIMAIGATFVIISGGIDISVGSVFGLSALATAYVLEHLDPHASAWIVLPVALVVPVTIGLICGIINGSLVVGLQMHPFIVSLGTLSIFRGVALVAPEILHETKSLPSFGHVIPDAFTRNFMMWTVHYHGVDLQPVPMIIMLVLMVIGGIYLRMTVGGRQIYAVGGNEEAARYSGLPVRRIKLRVYAISGLSAGIAGMMIAGFYGAADTATGMGYELMVIAAAVVGGASLLGGRGSALGAVLGMLIIQLIQNGIFVLHKIRIGSVELQLSKEYSMIIVGTAIIVAVAIDRITERLRNRRMTRAARGA